MKHFHHFLSSALRVAGLLIAVVFAFCAAPVSAEQRIIEADGTYTIGDGLDENISVAKERARTDALRNASEQASVFVESLSVVQEGMLTKDEIRVISANIMQLQGEPKFKIIPVSDDVIRYQCHVTVLVDTDNISQNMISDKQSLDDAVRRNQELTEEVARLNAEMERLKQQYAGASTEQERRQIRQEVRRNDEGFVAAQLNEQGADLFGQGRYDEAIGCFNQAIEKNPRFAFAYHNRGSAYGKVKNYTQAIADFTQAIAIDANYATAYSGRGFAYCGTEDYERAAADFSRAISLSPNYAAAYYGRGIVYTYLGHYEEAMRDYQKALAINPQLDAARTNLDMIRKALNR